MPSPFHTVKIDKHASQKRNNLHETVWFGVYQRLEETYCLYAILYEVGSGIFL
jgi:hypothetical protein